MTARTTCDWPKLLDDLAWLLGPADFAFPNVRRPAGTEALASYLGMSRGAVRNMLDGTEPRYSQGRDLIAAWVRLSGKTEANLPTCRVSFSAARS